MIFKILLYSLNEELKSYLLKLNHRESADHVQDHSSIPTEIFEHIMSHAKAIRQRNVQYVF